MRHNAQIYKVLTGLSMIWAAVVLCAMPVQAQEITAINFDGDLLGKVIPDGKVVGFDNRLIGNVTADSLIVDFEGVLIGGVVPQGIAIGNDARPLGKVSSDGSVRLASGQIVGRVLPTGLVINNDYDIIGGVVFPGLVYSDKGKTVGRITGDGRYTNLQGQQIGLVTPDGYAYRKIGDDYTLDGRLMSSKMVVSLQGEFIGSVNPGGQVSDFDAKIIGSVRANGFVYNDQNRIVGRTVSSGYAFDTKGNYLGIVTYNGEVVDGEKLVGRIRADGLIVNADNAVIGNSIGITAAATDFRGRYLGRLLPEGRLARAKETIAQVGARGNIFNPEGEIVGRIIRTGPVYDYKGSLRGHALSSGEVITLDGTPVGYMIGADAYDLSGRIVGAVGVPQAVFASDNGFLGISGIGSLFQDRMTATPFGYVYNQEGAVAGGTLPISRIYSQNGVESALLGLDGRAVSLGGSEVGRVVNGGFVLNGQSQLIGKTLEVLFAVSPTGGVMGSLNAANLIMNAGQNIIAKILPDNSVVESSSADTANYMPKTGQAFGGQIVLDFAGRLLGYTDVLGRVNNQNGSKIGRVTGRGLVVDNNNLLIGALQSYGLMINDGCAYAGVVAPEGAIRNYRGTYLGRLLENNDVISDSGAYLGYVVRPAVVIDASGQIMGYSGADGKVTGADGSDYGCLRRDGRLFNADGALIGRAAVYASAINFDGKIIGQALLDGKLVDSGNRITAYQQPNGNVNSDSGLPVGAMFEYKVAFGFDNRLIGYVREDGYVVNNKDEEAGQVNFEGYVVSDGKRIGYALYGLYVYDAEDKVVGYVTRNGEAVGFANQNLGQYDRGFVLNRKGETIARAARDYNIRDNEHKVLGRLELNGNVVADDGSIVGKLAQAGEIVSADGKVLAVALPLQYYGQISVQNQREMIFDKDGNFVGYKDKDGNLVDKDGNSVGKVLADGTIVDAEGNVIGDSAGQAQKGLRLAYDKDGNIIGYIDEDGNVRDFNGNIIGKVLEDGTIVDLDGNVIGKVGETVDLAYDKAGNVIGYATSDGKVLDANGKEIGRVTENGTIVDASGNIIGGIGPGWYKKETYDYSQTDDDDVSPALKLLESKQYRKSLGIALTPDGEYLGEILEDYSVVDKDGKVIGHRMPDGLIMDDDGTLIGVEEISHPQEGSIFVPPGTFGDGGAYGTGAGSPGNLGPGGGYGPGERYDPVRQAALNAEMANRRKNITVGKISNSARKEAFDGMQKDWEEQGIGKVISSWRVNLSEMILADKPIPAVIARAIDSNNPAPVTAYVERNVYAEEGRNVIIPAGSRLIGTLGSVTASTEETSEAGRVSISWERLIRPDGSLFVFQGLTADAQGRGGALGYVDKQLFKKYTLPVLTTSLTSATAYFMAPSKDNTGESESPRQQAANDARQNFINEMNSIFDEILADKSNIKPLTYVPAGTRIIVFPQTDLWLRTIERDQEASLKLENPNVFINDKVEASRRTGAAAPERPMEIGAPTSEVIYDAGAGVEDVESVKVSQPLVSSKKKKQTGLTPPPPPSNVVNAGSAQSETISGTVVPSGGGNVPASNNNNSVPALF